MNYFSDIVFNKKDDKLFSLLVLLLVCALTYIIYYDSLFYGKSNYDDHIYFGYLSELFKNGVSFSAFAPIISDFVNSNWHPVTVLSLAIDFVISGGDPLYFHITNTFIHIANAMMVFLVFSKLSNNRVVALLTTILFIVHPLNVETVVWISERKGLLSTFFALYSIYFYIKYKEDLFLRNKIISIILFMLSLLSKPTTATIPVVLILLDLTVFNENSKLNFRVLFDSLKDKLLYFAVGAGVIVLSFMAQSDALSDLTTVTLTSRLETSINNIFIYISKIFIPISLASYYPHPENSIYIVSLYAICRSSWIVLAIKYFSKSKLFTFCVLFFFIQILPLSGLFQTGSHSIANRYTYLPAIGMFFIVSFFLYQVASRRMYIFISFILVFFLTVTSLVHSKVWKSNLSLWENNANVTDANYYTAYFYTMLLIEENKTDKALEYFFNIIGIKNKYYADQAVSEVAVILTQQKKYSEAKTILEAGIKNNVKGTAVYRQLALLDYFYFGDKKQAEVYIKAVLKSDPEDLQSNRIYAKILLEQKNYKQSLAILNSMKNMRSPKKKNFKRIIEKDVEIINQLIGN